MRTTTDSRSAPLTFTDQTGQIHGILKSTASSGLYLTATILMTLSVGLCILLISQLPEDFLGDYHLEEILTNPFSTASFSIIILAIAQFCIFLILGVVGLAGYWIIYIDAIRKSPTRLGTVGLSMVQWSKIISIALTIAVQNAIVIIFVAWLINSGELPNFINQLTDPQLLGDVINLDWTPISILLNIFLLTLDNVLPVGVPVLSVICVLLATSRLILIIRNGYVHAPLSLFSAICLMVIGILLAIILLFLILIGNEFLLVLLPASVAQIVYGILLLYVRKKLQPFVVN